jgi:hypothetical protein
MYGYQTGGRRLVLRASLRPPVNTLAWLGLAWPGYYSPLPTCEDETTECSETSPFNIQTLGKYPEENIQYLQHGECLKTTNIDY